MASLCKDANGNKRIIFVDTDGKRKPIRLGKMPMEAARQIKTKVEHLVGAKTSRCAWNAETALWVSELDSVLADKLAAVGLIPKRTATKHGRAGLYLGDFLKDYIKGREADAKPNTLANLRQAERYLVECFGADKLLREISAGDGDDYGRWIRGKVGEQSARRHLGRAKQFFRVALRKRLIAENPLADMKGLSVQANKTREFFVSRDDAAKVLEACIDDEWKLLFALARFGGLRTPSESLAITWGNIDWERGRIRVPSAKTEHHEGHGERIIPLFDELRPLLSAVYDAAPEGSVYVISRYRDAKQNLRTQLARTIRASGLTPWPKLWQNLRASRATELAAEHPAHVAAAWLGHSTVVAAKHYWQVTDEDFDKAARNPARKQAQQPTAEASTTSHESKEPRESRVFAHLCDNVQSGEYPRQESNAPTLSADGVSGIENCASASGAQTGAPKPDSDIPSTIDTDLASLVAAWPKLPEATRQAIVRLLGKAGA